MNAQWFPLTLSNGVQVVPAAGWNIGTQVVVLSLGTLPAAGTVKIEYMQPGETVWRTPPGGAAISMLSTIAVTFYGYAADAQRVATYLTWYEGATDLPLPP